MALTFTKPCRKEGARHLVFLLTDATPLGSQFQGSCLWGTLQDHVRLSRFERSMPEAMTSGLGLQTLSVE